MTENGYTKDEILKGERIVLQVRHHSAPLYCIRPSSDETPFSPTLFQTDSRLQHFVVLLAVFVGPSDLESR